MTFDTFVESENVFEESLDCDAAITDSILEWLSPRISFSSSFTPLDIETPAKREEYIRNSADFEFSMSASSDDSLSEKFMLTADEFFIDGKLLPLPIPSHILMSADLPSSTENQEARCPTIAAYLDAELSDQASVLSSSTTSSTPCSSSFSRLSPRSPKRSSSWSKLRNLFNPKKDETLGIQGSFSKSADSCKFWKLFRRGRPGGQATNIPSFLGDFSLMAAPTDTVKAKSSQAIAFLPVMPSHSICCYFPSKDQDEITLAEEAIYDYHRNVNFRDEETIRGQCKTTEHNPESTHLKSVHATAKSTSVPCTVMSSPDTTFRKERGSRSMKDCTSSAKRLAATQLERSKTNPRSLEMLQNQSKASKQRDHSKSHQGKMSGYDRKPYSEKMIGSSHCARVTPVLNVPAFLSPSLRRANSKGKLANSQELISRNRDHSRFHGPLRN
ncbi:hypothetical protein O6H91_15G072900 [Diphasiastrum complanatum]|uniref:Uncharacterized protein n=1 Tax=Diphasiastrum complanatum TaxID=34168 RepID=A0ACC2BJP1_DIPCM|nr:hypothetical protein O6H91_15G072900 [Diphasiastrum complanatum]